MNKDLDILVKVLGYKSNRVPINLRNSIGECTVSYESDPLGEEIVIESPTLRSKFVFTLYRIGKNIESVAQTILEVIIKSKSLLLPRESCVYIPLYLNEDSYVVQEYYIDYTLEEVERGKDFISRSAIRQFWNLQKQKVTMIVSHLRLNLPLGTKDIPEYPMTSLSTLDDSKTMTCRCDFTRVIRGQNEKLYGTKVLDSELVFWKIVEGTIYDWYEVNK